MSKFSESCKYFAIAFTALHLYFLVKNSIWSFDFFNHFSNPYEMLSGLWALLYIALHLWCLFLGICLYLGVKGLDKDLVSTFLIGMGVITFSSLTYFLLQALLKGLPVFQMVAWTLHILTYFAVLFLAFSFYKELPKEDTERSVEEGQVHVESQKVATLVDKIFEGIQREAVLGAAVISGFFGRGNIKKKQEGGKNVHSSDGDLSSD